MCWRSSMKERSPKKKKTGPRTRVRLPNARVGVGGLGGPQMAYTPNTMMAGAR